MAIKTIRVCDRCGKYIEYRGWTARIRGYDSEKFLCEKYLTVILTGVHIAIGI